jgi:SAM-dependent methyltransferase
MTLWRTLLGPQPGKKNVSTTQVTTSFRDPAGRVAILDNRVFRVVAPDGQPNLQAYLKSRTVKDLVDQGRIVSTRVLEPSEAGDVLHALGVPDDAGLWMALEHEAIAFPSFAYEWPAEMLAAAGRLTLDLAETLLPEGLGVKDATPYNVLFRGSEPVFVDVLSIEPRRATDPLWLPYAQFLRTFLLPLIANKYLHQPLNTIFITRRDGLEPEEVYNWTGPLRRMAPPFLTTVSIPKWLTKKALAQENKLYSQRSEGADKASFILRSQFRGLRKKLEAAEPDEQRSKWSNYTSTATHYSSSQADDKVHFVRDFLAEFRPATVLDVGCNTGVFSRLAAEVATEVVAVDSDPVVVGKVYRQARAKAINILPLVIDLARPTPSLGWWNGENPSFLQRAAGHFEAVMMLAVIHHMLVTERVPLDDIVSLAAHLTRDLWLVEYVATDDPMFRKLSRGRDQLHQDLNPEAFERACQTRFELIRKQPIAGTGRIMYVWGKRRA